jgi:hypothetical protein
MYEVAFTRVDNQWQEFEATSRQLMTRALLSAVLMPLFAVGLVAQGWPSRWFGLPYAVALVLFIAMSVIARPALRIEFEDFRPHMLALATMHENYDSELLESWINCDALVAIERNDARLLTLRRTVRMAIALSCCQVATVVVTLAIQVLAF